MKDEVDFLHADKRQRFLQIDTVILGVCVARHTLIIQNYNFAILKYLKKEVSDEVGFLHAVKHQSLLQIDTLILMGMVKYSQSNQSNKFAIYLQYLKKEVRNGVDFLHADKHKFLQFRIIVFDGSRQTCTKAPKIRSW